MENGNFLSILGNYIKEPCSTLFRGCDILTLEVDKSALQLEATVRSDSFIPASDVWECQRMIARAGGLNGVKLQMKYLPTLLNAGCFSSLVDELKTMSGVVNGFFDNAEAVIADGRMDIDLKNGGKELLLNAGVDKLMQKLVHDRFSVNVKVEFGGLTEIQPQDYDVPPPIVVPESVMNRSAEKPAPQQRQFGGGNGGGNSGGYQRRNAGGVKEPTAVTIDLTEMRFKKDGAMLLKGRKITQMPMDTREKVQQALSHMLNEGDGGMICILF